MDKLTQFVSKSFENNNNSVISGELNSKMRSDSPVLDGYIKSENDGIQCDDIKEQTEMVNKPVPVAKNWLISETPKHAVQSYGIDLRLNNNPNVIYTSSLILNPNRNNPESNAETDQMCTVSSLTPKVKWYDNSIEMKSPSPKNSCSSSSSPIDLEDSKSCPETLISEKNVHEDVGSSLLSKDNDKKICEFNYKFKSLKLDNDISGQVLITSK